MGGATAPRLVPKPAEPRAEPIATTTIPLPDGLSEAEAMLILGKAVAAKVARAALGPAGHIQLRAECDEHGAIAEVKARVQEGRGW